MDTLTHALSGALLARATAHQPQRPSPQKRTVAGLVAAAFPDLDYVFYWLIPSEFLNLHRGPTHSLILLPLWALLLAVMLARLMGGPHRWRDFYGVCALGLGVHILGDVITIYGTKIFAPLSDQPVALGLAFDFDPYIAAIILAGCAGAVIGWRPARMARLSFVLIAAYLLLQAVLQWRTLALGEAFKERQGLIEARVYALPQPLSPFTRQVVVAQGDRYFVAYLNFLAWNGSATLPEDAWFVKRMIAAYQPLHALRWSEQRRFGATAEAASIARLAWQQDIFSPFRRFTVLPALYRIDQQGQELCVWFTDLRHALPAIPPAFRYGMCRASPQGDWRLYRLRYFSHNHRQLLQ